MTEPSKEQDSLLGHVFDQYQNLMQIARCVREVARQRGRATPRVLELSRRPTGLEAYLPDAEIVRVATHDDEQPILGDPVTLALPDGAFDASFITDSYEHITQTQRPQLLAEMIRVTQGIVLIGSPVQSTLVNHVDHLLFDFVWGKYAERYEPLEQHITFGVDALPDILAEVERQGADRAIALPGNYVYRWVHQILLFFDLQHANLHGDVFEPLNRIYNAYLSPFDYREPCYRYLIVARTSSEVDLATLEKRLMVSPEAPPSVAEVEDALLHYWRIVDGLAADRLRASAAREAAWQKELSTAVSQRDEMIRALQQELLAKVGERDEMIQALQQQVAAERGSLPRPAMLHWQPLPRSLPGKLVRRLVTLAAPLLRSAMLKVAGSLNGHQR